MAQVSLPMRIALVGAMAFTLVWFVLLRPKPEEPVAADPVTPAAVQPKAPAPAKSGDGGTSIIERPAAAKDAVAKANAQIEGGAAKTGAADAASPTVTPVAPSPSGSASAPAPSAATPAPAAAAPPKSAATGGNSGVPAGEAAVLGHLDRGRVVILVFYTPNGTDDLAARRAAQTVASPGKVIFRAVSVKNVGDYEAITRGVTVAETPTTLVIGPERQAVSLTGLIDPLEVRQAVRAVQAER